MSRAELAAKKAESIKPPSERAIIMARLYVEDGLTLAEIGERYGISRERVRQIIKPFGLEAHYGRRRKEGRARLLREAHQRIASRESTTAQEAERIGYASPSGLYGAFSRLGLLLPQKPPAEHGTTTRYRSGCRCEDCRRENRRKAIARRARGPKVHGSSSSYFNYGCRCQECSEAGRRYRRERKRASREGTPTD